MLISAAESSRGLGDGRIDNLIIDTSVHLVMGLLVVVAMLATTGLVAIHAWRGQPVGRPAMISMVVAQIALTLQLLLGIKLLDQGQGIVQLYIHYVGGLVPLGIFLVAGWLARGDTVRGTRVLAAMLAVGCLSALMAFFIGRAYANSLV